MPITIRIWCSRCCTVMCRSSIKTLSLLHLLDSLVHRSEATGLCLMQVGEFLPSLFANDNIMPVQLSEAAIALFRMGQCQVAWELLRSCGLAFSVYTESPGSAPERFGINGRGEANYVFGNPSAAFPYAVIAGLFGIRYQKQRQKTLRYAPAYLPDENLSLTQDGVVFTAENNRYTMTGAGGWESVGIQRMRTGRQYARAVTVMENRSPMKHSHC